MIVSPWGDILGACSAHRPSISTEQAEAFLGQEDPDLFGCEICYADFDRELISKIRSSMPVQDHKRRDIYFPASTDDAGTVGSDLDKRGSNVAVDGKPRSKL